MDDHTERDYTYLFLHSVTAGQKQYLKYLCYGFKNETNLHLEWQYNNASESSLSILQCGYIPSVGWEFFGLTKSNSHLLKDIDRNRVFGCSFKIYPEMENELNKHSIDSHEIILTFYPENFNGNILSILSYFNICFCISYNLSLFSFCFSGK